MLCKHEVVGSIPSGSTIFWDLALLMRRRSEQGVEPAIWNMRLPQPGCCEDRLVPQGRLFGEDISDIVKRECGRWGREICQPRRSCSASIRWWVRKRICHWSFCDRVALIGQPYGCRISDGHRSRERSSALRAFGGCLGAERR